VDHEGGLMIPGRWYAIDTSANAEFIISLLLLLLLLLLLMALAQFVLAYLSSCFPGIKRSRDANERRPERCAVLYNSKSLCQSVVKVCGSEAILRGTGHALRQRYASNWPQPNFCKV